MTFNAATLACIAQELQCLVGGQLQRIVQPSPLQVVLSIYKSGLGEKHLLLDVSPQFYRAHLTTERAANLLTPPPFGMTLRKHLNGGTIASLTQRNGDRILDVRVQNNGEEYLLSVELMGKHANLILVSAQGTVLQAAKLITNKHSRVREVLPGREYSAPPAPRFDAPLPLQPDETSAQLDIAYRDATANAAFEQQRRALCAALGKTLSQKQRALEQVRRGVEESTRAAQYRRWGELILGHLQEVKMQMEQGSDVVEVLDFYDETGATARIPLESDLSAQENANAFFRRARHVEENAEALQQRAHALASEVAEIETHLHAVEAPDCTPETLHHLHPVGAHGCAPQTPAPKTSTTEFSGHKIKRFTSPDGYEVLIGENATANDHLVTRLSHGNDWWLHLRGGTSAHAIIRTGNAPDRVPRSTLLFAARLVVARSIAKHAGWAEVDYTLRKYVRKPRKAAPGAVVHTNAKTLHVEPQ
jgi:predicted ribosome quality control (RQC) complex YloA/Tae2 family protein